MQFPFEYSDTIGGQTIASYSGYAVISSDRTNGDPDDWLISDLFLDALVPVHRVVKRGQPQCWRATSVAIPLGHHLYDKVRDWVLAKDSEVSSQWLVHAANARRERVEA